MEYKISELVAKTGTPKSTILYYIREGLLPEAKKLKSNVHRYNNEHAERIEYIKYMKNELGSSNEQIRVALENRDESLSSSAARLAPLMHTLSNIPLNAQHFSKKEFIAFYDVDTKLLDTLLDDGILMPLSPDDFTDKEAAIIRLVEDFKEVGLDYELLKAYVHHARELASIEYQVKDKFCDIRNEDNQTTLWKIMFETLFNAKEYLFSRYTHKLFFQGIKDEIKTQEN